MLAIRLDSDTENRLALLAKTGSCSCWWWLSAIAGTFTSDPPTKSGGFRNGRKPDRG